MNKSQSAPRKRNGLLALALITTLVGGVFIYIGTHNFPVRVVGLAIVMAGAHLIQVANAQNRSTSSVANVEMNNRNSARVFRRALWIVSLSLVPIVGVAWYLFSFDAQHGGKVLWPLYLLTGVVLFSAVVWGLLVAMILGGRTSPK